MAEALVQPPDTTDADGKASVSFKLSGTNAVVHTVKATDNTSLTGESASITVNKGAGVKYILTNSVNTIVAGSSLNVTAQLVDDNDLPVSTSGKVVTWTKDNANGSFASSTSTTDANGKATVVFTAHTLAGTTHTITATDDENLQGTGSSITTIEGDGTKYTITANNTTPVAGEIVTVSVQLVDENNNKVTTAGKTVTWTKSDDNSVLPSSQTNSNGIATFIFTSSKVADNAVVVTAKDVETQKEYSTTITTKAGPASKYLVSSETDKPVAGAVITIDAQLVDANDNPVKAAGITINWSKTDANGSFAANSSLTNANGLATVKFTTHTLAATQTTITATDSNNLKGSTATITTQTGAASKFLFTVSNYSPIAGTNVTISAQLVDANNNPVNEAGKSITWSKSDANGSFASPASLTNTSGTATIEFTSHTVVNTSTSITASTAEGIKSSSDIIKTIAAAPKDLTYLSPVVLTAGETMQNLSPSVTGLVTEYSISPDVLPNGLTFDKNTGIISGKPLAESIEQTFVVTAKNGTGSTSFSLRLTVLPAPTPEVNIINNQTFQLKDDIITMEVETEDSNGNPNQIVQDNTRKDVSKNFLILENSLTVKVAGSGFLPGSDIKVEMFSNPQLLGIVPVDANGSFRASLQVSPDTEVGTHTIKTTGVDITQVERKLAIGLVFNMEKPTASIITGYTAERGKVSIDFVDTDKRPDLFTSRQYSLDNGLSWNFFPDASISSPLILKNLSEKEINKIIIRVANSIGFSDASNEIAVFIGDNDGDLVPDYVESKESSDATNPKLFKDSDKDGVPDYVEESDGSNANNAADFKDTDKGGVPDYVESILYKFYDLMISDPMLASDDSRDTDGDGVIDYHEILAGTNPKDGPANLSYSGSSVKVLKGNSLKLLPTFSKGKPNQYSISPALPEGLSIDPNTGVISGTLTANISGTITYTIKASNAFGTVETQLTIIYNSVPTDIILSNNVIEENNAADALIGTLTTIDPDTGDAHAYSLPAGLSADNQFFKIEGSSLSASRVFDYEKQKSYSITVRTTDMSGAVLDKVFIIKVLDGNEPPTKIILSASGMYENNTIGSLVANLSTEDLDSDDTHTYSIVNGDMSSFSLSGNRLISNEKYDYARKKSYTVRIRTEDKSGLYHEQDLTIQIHKAPVIFGTGNETGTKIRTAPSTNPIISKGFTSDLSVSGDDIVKYQWSADPSLSALTTSNPVAKPLINNVYELTVTNKSGATTVVYITIEVMDDFNITPNNIITPDGDGVNDFWKVENIENYPDNEVMIFDKAGRVIFRQKGYANTWDGRLNQSVLTEGVYYYMIKSGEGSIVKKGYINLLYGQGVLR